MENTMTTTIAPGSTTTESSAPDTAALAQMNGTTAVATVDRGPVMGFGGAVSAAAMRPAYLKLAYSVSKTKPMDILEGSICMGKEWTLLAKPTKPVQAIILGCSAPKLKTYDTMAPVQKRYNNEAEARAAGEILEFGPKGSDIKPTVTRYVDVLLLVKKPDDVEDESFCYYIGNDFYAPAILSADKASYAGVHAAINKMVVAVASFEKTTPDKVRLDGAYAQLFTSVSLTSGGKNSWRINISRMIKDGAVATIPQKVRDEIRALTAGQAEVVADDADLM